MRRAALVFRMNWLIRQSAALVAIYSIALQSLLSGFVLAAHIRFDSFAVICTTRASSGHEPSIPQHGSECIATCLAVCSDSPVLGVAKMRPIKEGLEIKPGETVELKPGSFHVMLVGLKKPLASGDHIKGTLVFEKAGTVSVEYDVVAMGSEPAGMKM